MEDGGSDCHLCGGRMVEALTYTILARLRLRVVVVLR